MDPSSPIGRAAQMYRQGLVHARSGNLSDALACLDEATALDPSDARFHNEHANVLRGLGRHVEALAAVAKAAKLLPEDPATHFNLGQALATLNRHSVAIAVFDKVIFWRPGEAMVHAARARSLKELRRYEESLIAFDQAIALRGPDANLLGARGNVLLSLQRVPEALKSLEQASQLDPRSVVLANDHGNALFALGRYHEALEIYRRAAAQSLGFVPALCNIAVTLTAMRDFDGAKTAFARALDSAPTDAFTRFNFATALLLQGDLPSGLSLFEARWELPGFEPHRHADIPPWTRDTDVVGKRILLWSEQGLGDTIQFSRYAALIGPLGARVALEVDRCLAPTLRTLPREVEVLAKGDPLPLVDLQAPLMNVAGLIGADLTNVPSAVPYLRAAPDKVAAWRERLASTSAGLRVGVAVSGRATHMNDFNRSMPLRTLRPIYGLASLFLLQTEVRRSDEPELAQSPIKDLRAELQDLNDTAALIDCLDLVISVDTSVVHLAGALARPVWVLLPFLPDWRWLLDRSDSPWYPSARLFRQACPGDWSGVVNEVIAALRSVQATLPRTSITGCHAAETFNC